MIQNISESIRLIEQGQLDQAVELCEQLLKDPQQRPDALHILGFAAAHQGESERAIELLGQAVAADPENDERKLNLGRLAIEVGSIDVALETLTDVASRYPENPGPQTLLGSALTLAQRYEEAVAAHEKAVKLAPDSALIWSQLASSYLAWGKNEAAEAGNAYAVQLEPSSADLHFNLGGTRVLLGRLEEAKASFEAALELDPNHAKAMTSLGIIKRALGDLEAALEIQRKAVEIAPEDPDVQWNLAMSELFAGFHRSGWRRYEVRRQRYPQDKREGHGESWDGKTRQQDTLTIEREQGIGDTLMFSRFLAEARGKVQKLVFRCRPEMVTLLQEGLTADVEVVAMPVEPPTGLYAPLLSLPHLLEKGSKLEPQSVPYITVKEERIELWKQRLNKEQDARPCVGLVWQGNPHFPADKTRSVALHKFLPILQLQGVRFISLQQVHGTEQLVTIEEQYRPEIFENIDQEGAFLDTAAIMKNLDLMVSVDSAPLHLAGAMGIQTAALIQAVPDWRWGQGLKSWYPTLQGFQQFERGDWTGAIEQLRSHLISQFNLG